MGKRIKESDKIAQKYNINESITAHELRLVGDDFDAISVVAGKAIDIGVYPTRQLLRWAQDLEMDLIEISPNAIPPVVKISDFNKFIFEKKKKEKEIKANTVKTVVKEIRFGPNTDEHDFEFKVKHAKKFLEEGSKVKAYVQFRGRAIVFQDRGELLLLKFLKELDEVGAAESLPKLEGRKMLVMVTSKKSQKKN